jgi:hypothetical protein
MLNRIGRLRGYEVRARILSLVCLPLLLTCAQGQTVASRALAPAGAQKARTVEGYGKLPLAFESNQGQTDPQVKFFSRGTGYSLFLTSREAVLTLHGSSDQKEPVLLKAKVPNSPAKEIKSTVLNLKLLGASAKVELIGQDEMPGKSNYFIGNDPKKWHTGVPEFAKVRYANVYPGVDLVYYGHQRELECDFVLQTGAQPEAIRLGIEGAQELRLDHGDLVLTTAGGDLLLRSPHIYQELNGVRQAIRGSYVVRNNNEVGFEVAPYDRSRALVIDPVLAYSTYLGGSNTDLDAGIALDSEGNAYVTGYTYSSDFPTANALQPAYGGSVDVFVTKINREGTALVYSTYLGGSSGDYAYGIAVDSAGNAYATGATNSTDFPTANAIQPGLLSGTNAFVTKINADGSALAYSTYLGGSAGDGGWGIAVDSAGNSYVTGFTSGEFPTVNALQPTFGGAQDAFVTKINASGSAFIYSTYLGGTQNDWPGRIAADSAGNAYVTGATDSTDFPSVHALQPAYGGNVDAFVTKINPSGSAFIYSTYLGGSLEDDGFAIVADAAGNAYLSGTTDSTDFPTAHPIQPAYGGGGWDAFVAKINPSGGALVYSTYLGGGRTDSAGGVGNPHGGIALDSAGNAYVAGWTDSTDFPTVNALQSTSSPSNVDAFVTEISAGGTALVYSTYFGGTYPGGAQASGIAVDAAGSAYIAGLPSPNSFPTTPVAFQPLSSGRSQDVFIAKIAQQTFVSVSPAQAKFLTLLVGATSKPKKLTLTNNGTNSLPINRIFIGGLNPGDFAEVNTCGASLAPGAGCTISITFTPTTKNTRAAGLGISTSDPASPNSVRLSGPGTVVSFSKAKLTFGDQSVGTSSPPQSVTLTNIGSAQLNFKKIILSGANKGDFSETNTCGSSIAAHANCTITVTFKPTATGTRKAVVRFTDDGGGSPQQVSLSGTGT